LHFDENEDHATSEVMIIILNPSHSQNKIKKCFSTASKYDNANGYYSSSSRDTHASVVSGYLGIQAIAMK